MGSPDINKNEIDILDLVRMALKRKKIILFTFLIILISASILSYLGPRPREFWKVSEFLKTPLSSENKNLMNINEIKCQIQEGIYSDSICKDIGLSASRDFGFKVDLYDTTSILKISLVVEKKDIDLAKSAMDSLNKFLSAEALAKINEEKDRLAETAVFLTTELENREVEKRTMESTINDCKAAIENKKKEKTALQAYLISLTDKKSRVYEDLSAAQAAAISNNSTNDIQTKAYINNLNSYLASIEIQEQQLMLNIKDHEDRIKLKEDDVSALLGKINYLNNDITSMSVKKQRIDKNIKNINNFTVMRPPWASPDSLYFISKTKKIIAGGMLGLVCGMLLAVFLEIRKKVATDKK